MIEAIKAQVRSDWPGIRQMLRDMLDARYIRRDMSFLFAFLAGSGTLIGANAVPSVPLDFAPTAAFFALASAIAGWRMATRQRAYAQGAPSAPLGALLSVIVSLVSSTLGALLSMGIAHASGYSGMIMLVAPMALLVAISLAVLIDVRDSRREKSRPDEPARG